MKQPEDLIWKSKTGKRMQYVMLLCIRFVEICMASIIPSIIGIVLVFINPNNRIMSIMCFLSFMAFAVCNWMFWMRYAKQRTKRTEFFLINGIAYLIYVVISYFIYEFTGAFLYSVLFSNLRGFEALGLNTPYSWVASHVTVGILMIICQIYSKNYYTKLLWKLSENGADAIEMDPWGDLVPMQKDRKIDILSTEEMYKYMEEERAESAKNLRQEIEQAQESLWDTSMTKGRGEKVETVEFKNIDADIDDADFIGDNGNYDVDVLWNREIYRGRTTNDAPVENYDDEPEDMPDFFAVNHYEGEEKETLWSSDMHQGKRDSYETVDIIEEEEDIVTENNFADYDTEGLWNNDMYQGCGRTVTRPDIKKEDKRELKEIPTENSKYSADNLWDNISQGRGNKTESEVHTNSIDDNE